MRPFNVLIAAAGRRVALVRQFRDALDAAGLHGLVFAADITPFAPAFHAADRGILVPRADAPEFAPVLLERCLEHEVRLVVPTTDRELLALAEWRDRFAAAGVVVAVSAPDAVRIGGDKVLTHRWLRANDFPTVDQWTAADALASPATLRFPLLVKPSRGASSIGVAIVDDVEQLRAATDPGHLRRISGGALDGEFVVQHIAPGHEYTVDVLVTCDGRAAAAVPRRRLEVRAGEVSKAVTTHLPDLEALARAVCERLPGAYGALNVQICRDDDGASNIIEINPRFGGGYPLTWMAGADFPRAIVEEIADPTRTPASLQWRHDLVMLRFDDAIFVEGTVDGRLAP